MVSVMKDVVQKGTAAGSVGALFHYPAGGKTGTTNDGTDVWFIGYTSDLVAGVWMGFDKPQKIKPNAQGGILAAPAWTAFMNEVYRRKPAAGRLADAGRHRHAPDRRERPTCCATPYCPREPGRVTEFFIPGTDPVEPCNVHTGPGSYPDTTGVGALYPRPTRSTTTTRRWHAAVVVPGAATPIQRGRRAAGDTSRRFRDSAIFALPPRDTRDRRCARLTRRESVPGRTRRVRPRPTSAPPKPARHLP